MVLAWSHSLLSGVLRIKHYDQPESQRGQWSSQSGQEVSKPGFSLLSGQLQPRLSSANIKDFSLFYTKFFLDPFAVPMWTFQGTETRQSFQSPKEGKFLQHSGLSWKWVWFIVWTVLDRQAGKENEHRFAWSQGSPDGCSCCLHRTLALWSYSWRSFSALLLPSWVFWDSQPQYSHQQNGNNYSIDHRGWLWGYKYIIAI